MDNKPTILVILSDDARSETKTSINFNLIFILSKKNIVLLDYMSGFFGSKSMIKSLLEIILCKKVMVTFTPSLGSESDKIYSQNQ